MTESIQKAKALFAPVPHVQLGFFPTPFYKLENMSKALGVNLYIKRDDFTGMNLFGGNKIRKLEFLLGDAIAKGCKAVVTYGATQSNHAMETVSACRRCGLEPILYLTAVVKPDKEDVRANLLLDQVMGAEIHIVDIEPGETEDDAEARSFVMGAEPRSPPISTMSPTFLPSTGITRTAVVLLLTMPIAASSAMMAEMVSAEVSPGTAIMSSPTEQTQVIASNLSIVSVPSSAAAIMPSSSETGMNAPERPPT